MFVLTVFKKGIAKNDNVPDEPRRTIIEVSMLSDYGLCCLRIKLTGFITLKTMLKNQPPKRRTRARIEKASNRCLPLSNRSSLPIVHYQPPRKELYSILL